MAMIQPQMTYAPKQEKKKENSVWDYFKAAGSLLDTFATQNSANTAGGTFGDKANDVFGTSKNKFSIFDMGYDPLAPLFESGEMGQTFDPYWETSMEYLQNNPALTGGLPPVLKAEDVAGIIVPHPEFGGGIGLNPFFQGGKNPYMQAGR